MMFMSLKILPEPTLSMKMCQKKYQHFYTAEYLVLHLLNLAYA